MCSVEKVPNGSKAIALPFTFLSLPCNMKNTINSLKVGAPVSKAFNRSVFGGFNRQDVIEYLETVSKEREALVALHKKQMAKLRDRLEQSERQLEKTEQTAENVKAVLELEREDHSRLKQHCQTLESELEQVRAIGEGFEQTQLECERLRAALDSQKSVQSSGVTGDKQLLEGLSSRIESLLIAIEGMSAKMSLNTEVSTPQPVIEAQPQFELAPIAEESEIEPQFELSPLAQQPELELEPEPYAPRSAVSIQQPEIEPEPQFELVPIAEEPELEPQFELSPLAQEPELELEEPYAPRSAVSIPQFELETEPQFELAPEDEQSTPEPYAPRSSIPVLQDIELEPEPYAPRSGAIMQPEAQFELATIGGRASNQQEQTEQQEDVQSAKLEDDKKTNATPPKAEDIKDILAKIGINVKSNN